MWLRARRRERVALVDDVGLALTGEVEGAAERRPIGAERGVARPGAVGGRPRIRRPEPVAPPSGRRLAPVVAVRQGLSEPLAIRRQVAFLTGLPAQFAPGDPSFGSMLGLGVALALMTLAWLAAYACAVERAGAMPAVRVATLQR
jgi:hypothetical protein